MPTLKTYRVVLDITTSDEIASPDEWEWGEIIDPDCSSYFWHTLDSVTPIALNESHAHDLANFNEPTNA